MTVINESGIYKIVNLVNGKMYIGSAVNFKRRKSQHMAKLRHNKHHNIYLQRAFNKYGEKSFIFEIIDTVSHRSELKYREDYWIGKYNFDEELYNIAISTFAPMLGRPLTEEHKRKISEANKGENHPQYGKPLAENIRKKISNTLKGNRLSKETRDKISKANAGKNHPMYGKKHTKKARNKMSKSHTDVKLSDTHKIAISKGSARKRRVNQIDPVTNEIINTFETIKDAQYTTGADSGHISAVCNQTNYKKGIRKTAGGYKWEYA